MYLEAEEKNFREEGKTKVFNKVRIEATIGLDKNEGFEEVQYSGF